MSTWDAIRRVAVAQALYVVLCPASAAIAQSASAATNQPASASAAMSQPPPASVDQAALARAKAAYASAEFEDALRVLESLKGTAVGAEASAYQMYCLVALGRRDEAKVVVERIVRADPFFRPAEGQVAPRVRAFFEETRKPLLLDVARQSYARARIAFDKNDLAPAATEFNRAITLFDEIGGADPDLVDLRTLAVAFRDRARAASPPIPTPIPTASPASSPVVSVVSAEPAIYGPQHLDVAAPIVISRSLPDWRPGFFELNHTFSGEIELVISEDGKVLTASMLASVHPRYDGLLLEAAKSWTFKPAMKNGVAVKYRYVMTVRILK